MECVCVCIYIYIYIYKYINVLKVDSYGAKFPALLHFIKRYKVPWILKQQYGKEGNVLTRHWYVKWWDKFPHTQEVIDNVTRDFPSPNALPIAKDHSLVRTAELANAPVTTSTKTVKSSTKSKKKSSPLDDICKDLDALYALLKLKWKEEEVADNHDSEDEMSSEASIANNPYFPYNQELFGMI